MAGDRSGSDGEIERFDQIAEEYSQLHEQNVGSSGESIEYFAQYKVDCLKRLGATSDSAVLDFGCGIGNVTEVMTRTFSTVAGYDPSVGSLKVARKRMPAVPFVDTVDQVPDDSYDFAVVAGVLHHVDPDSRAALISDALRKLRPGGKLVVFEHNPYNPLTRRAVSACPFDDEAILLNPRTVRATVSKGGAVDVRQDFIVFFPHLLRGLRPLEPRLRWLGLGAQTMTVGTRAAT